VDSPALCEHPHWHDQLLGKQPLDVLDDPSGDLAVIFLATHAICPMSKYAFNALRCEVENLQFVVIRKRLEDRRIERFAPANEDAARQLLNNLISREIGRLEQLALERRNAADAEAADRLSRLAFDPSDEADKVRRYEDAAIRRMSRSCMDFIKVRQNGILSEDADDEPGLVKGDGAHDDNKHDGTAGETGLDTPTPVPGMTEDSQRAAANGGPAAAGETAMNEMDAPPCAAVPSAGAPPPETTHGGPRSALHATTGPLLGLLLLIVLTWLMASGQGASLKGNLMRPPAIEAAPGVEPELGPSKRHVREPTVPTETDLRRAITEMRAIRNAGIQEVPTLALSWFPAVPTIFLEHSDGALSPADRPMAFTAPANTDSVHDQTGERHEPRRPRLEPNKAKLIYAHHWLEAAAGAPARRFDRDGEPSDTGRFFT